MSRKRRKHIPEDNGKVKSIITLSGDTLDPQFRVRLLDRDCPRQKGISLKKSLRWIDTFKTPNGGLNVPYIDNLGRFTGHTLYKWSCDPRSLIATVVSTISKRLVDYCRKHNKWHMVKKHLKPLVGAAAYYAFTKNSHFWDRILFFCRNLQERGTLIHRFRLFYSSKWSDYNRFVISQVIFQTNWLLSRVHEPRDKLLFYNSSKRTFWSDPSRAPLKTNITNRIRELAYAISSI
jgi:hypothetical protein